ELRRDGDDLAAGNRRPDRARVEKTWKRQVVDVPRLAGDLRGAFLAQDVPADGAGAHGVQLSTGTALEQAQLVDGPEKRPRAAPLRQANGARVILGEHDFHPGIVAVQQ